MGWGWLGDVASFAVNPFWDLSDRASNWLGGPSVRGWIDLGKLPDVPPVQPATDKDAFDVAAEGARNKSWLESSARAGYAGSFLIGPRGTAGGAWNRAPIDYDNMPLWAWAQRPGGAGNPEAGGIPEPSPPGPDTPPPITDPILQDGEYPADLPHPPPYKLDQLDPVMRTDRKPRPKTDDWWNLP